MNLNEIRQILNLLETFNADPYEVLGIPRSATPAEIKRAHREKVKANHPDATGRNTEEEMKLINWAYDEIKSRPFNSHDMGNGDEMPESASMYDLIFKVDAQFLIHDTEHRSIYEYYVRDADGKFKFLGPKHDGFGITEEIAFDSVMNSDPEKTYHVKPDDKTSEYELIFSYFENIGGQMEPGKNVYRPDIGYPTTMQRIADELISMAELIERQTGRDFKQNQLSDGN